MSYSELVVRTLSPTSWYKRIYFSVSSWDKYYNTGVCGPVVVTLWKLYHSEETRAAHTFFSVQRKTCTWIYCATESENQSSVSSNWHWLRDRANTHHTLCTSYTPSSESPSTELQAFYKMMKKIGHSRAVYEVNLSEDHESVPGSSPTADPKVRRQEELPIPIKTASPRKEEQPKFKFTKFPVRNQETKSSEEPCTSPSQVNWLCVCLMCHSVQIKLHSRYYKKVISVCY